MGLFELMDSVGGADCEQVVHCRDARSGLRAIIAIHSTALGPALGGTRFRPYAAEEDALLDVLRLARAMSYKAAAAGLDLGGGKAVVNGDPGAVRSEALLRSYGRVVESLGGRYITAEDVGTTVEDMAVVAQETRHVVGRSVEEGGLGDPSPSTALGVLVSMKAALAHLGDDTLEGRTIAVSGLGKVGAVLVRMLLDEGAVVAVADIDEERVDHAARDFGAKPMSTAEIHRLDCDVFAPCALGGVLEPNVIAELSCRAVVGAANNQLATPECADLLGARGIAYVPDFVANAGGRARWRKSGSACWPSARGSRRSSSGRPTPRPRRSRRPKR
jgi:glutamate dehydrogenase/leucine dehydrogenase